MNFRYSPGCLIFLFILAVLFSGCQMEKTPTKVGEVASESGQTAAESQDAGGQSLYEVGDLISIQDTLLIILGWDQPEGGDFNPPAEGKKYVAVDLLLANQGENSFSISPVFQMTLKDSSGQKYNLNAKANAATESNPPNGELNPGEVIRGTVGFQVPENVGDFVFVYEANLLGLGEVSVDLGPTPVSMEPPQDLGLEQAQEEFQIGDVVKISDLLIQVVDAAYPSGTDWVRPKEGWKFVIVDVWVENQGQNTREISSALQMYLKDASGRKYTLHLGAQSLADAGLPDDELQPGEKVRGQIGFHVPKTASGLIFVFDAEVIGFGKAFIALQ